MARVTISIPTYNRKEYLVDINSDDVVPEGWIKI